MTALRIAIWNINGLSPNILELETILSSNKIDVALLSESHVTTLSSIHLRGHQVYLTPHPDGRAHAGTAIVIRSCLKHSLLEAYSTDYLQATSIRLEDRAGPIVLSAVYCPPKHRISEQMFLEYFQTLGHRYIAGGDWNAKNTYWGSRCTVTRGRVLKQCVDKIKLQTWSSGKPTYWPSDPNRMPDLLDFFVAKGLSHLYTSIETCLDGSSDHTPVILNLCANAISCEKPESLYNFKTDWDGFRSYLDDRINLKVPLKSRDDVEEACLYITNLIQVAAWKNTPSLPDTHKTIAAPLEIKNKLEEKRRLRRQWHQTHHPADKTMYNRATRELKTLLCEFSNNTTKHTLERMSPNGRNQHSLWKASKSTDKSQSHCPPIKTGSSWARTDQEKAEAFASHLSEVFQPNRVENSNDESELDKILNQDLQLCLPIRPTSPREISRMIRVLETKKAPGYDLITPKILKELPRKTITFLACLFNAIFRIGCFPGSWKVSQIIMIHKVGKPAHETGSYRPISLTPVLSKLWERIFLVRLKSHIDDCGVIPSHQFGFRKSHSTTEQVHRVHDTIRQCFEHKLYCSAAFLDVQQAFDRVWHKGLLCKIKEKLPHSLFHILASYLSDRIFQVKHGDARSKFYNIEAGVPQGSVIGPTLYNIFTNDLPTSEQVTVATYADDIAYLSCHKSPEIASMQLQLVLDNTHNWLTQWRVRASAHKSNHITFSLRRGDCPPVKLGNDVLPHCECIKYLGFHLDRRLTWKTHIKHKRNEIILKYKNLHWLLGRNSTLSVDNKLLLYNAIIKPIWTYGIQLWGTASDSNIMCLQRAQNAILRVIANAPWFTRNDEIHDYLNMTTIKEEIKKFTNNYIERLASHPNPLASKLLDKTKTVHRLKRKHIVQN